MDNMQFWAVVQRLENAGLAVTAYDASTGTTGILMHPGIDLDLSCIPDDVVYSQEDVAYGEQTRNGMLCHGASDPEADLALVFEVNEDEDLPPWHYVLIDEGKWDVDSLTVTVE